MTENHAPSALSVLGTALARAGLYALIGLVVAALVALGTDGIKLTLVSSIACFGAAVSLGTARHLTLPAVLGLGAGVIAGLNALARVIDLTAPFTTYHPISAAVAAAVCLTLIYALRIRGEATGGTGQTPPA